MAFSLTSKQVELRGSWLVAVVQKDDGSWTFSKLNLNEHVGNKDGQFDVTIDRWYNTAEHWSCHLQGTSLSAQMMTVEGSWAPETCINLDLFVRNKDGSLEFQKLNDSLLFYTASLTLDNATLKGLVVGRDGKLYVSELNLDENIGNINGKFEAGERHYSRSGREFKLEQGLDTVKLIAELADYAGTHHPAEIDLAECIVNRNGQLSFLRPEETSDKEHWSTAIAEQIPGIGSAIAGLHRLGDDREDEERLYRQIASTTNSATVTVGTAIGAFIGRAIRGPVIGMVLGAGLSTTPGIFLDEQLSTADEDPELKSQIQEATVGRYVFETLRDMIAADQTLAAAELLDAALSLEIDNWKKDLVAWLERQEITLLTDFSLYTMMKRVFTRLRGIAVEEWDNALDQLAAIRARAGALKLEPEPEPAPEIIVEAPAADAQSQVTADQPSSSKTAEEPQTANESEAAEASTVVEPTSPKPSDEPSFDRKPDTTAASSTRASSLKPDQHRAAPPNGSPPPPPGGNGNKSAASVRRNGSSRKGWHNVLGISMFRSWSRHRQPKAVAV
ncbi:Cyanovirin-N [Jackrogersella minutella]|nr:Cyanovirin-N [Jackrogersella minutella]